MRDRDIIYLGCQRSNHDWQFSGGMNAGCSRDCTCSIPVHKCGKCGDFDYGYNPEAIEIVEQCAKSS